MDPDPQRGSTTLDAAYLRFLFSPSSLPQGEGATIGGYVVHPQQQQQQSYVPETQMEVGSLAGSK